MRHIRQKLRLTPIRELDGLPRSGVLLDTVTQVGHHLVDLCLQRVHLAARLDGNEATEVAVHGRRRDLRETSDLRRQVPGHRVHGDTVRHD